MSHEAIYRNTVNEQYLCDINSCMLDVPDDLTHLIESIEVFESMDDAQLRVIVSSKVTSKKILMNYSELLLCIDKHRNS